MDLDLARQISVTGAARALPFAAGVALLLAMAACGADRESYVEKNERLLETLPEVPGAETLRADSSPYYLTDSGPVDGYTTNVVYRAEPGVTAQDVVDFYVRNLRGDWEYCLEEIPTRRLDGAEPGQPDDSILLANFFRRGATSVNTTAMVSVNADGMFQGGPHTYEVVVDHRAYRNFCTGEDLR